ncbi:hypothetical protein IVB45_06245 [Bradyrhizobium sp. 4]|uniref:hypothetical protein n=1 Tax=unclassified Bradyrhizobium TaxID=2631580 RepID=UPI001FF9F5C1|nr:MULTISPECIES: hypothetical protein [unclassified Bradyrhizobium]MCK1401419.1 hypothetical protein [Bradyrhizobium sp. 39]MCK1750193.1 hypothetical protein [Bradyrhizobium sp. 135]UPJ36478.1 hypothetical protein IVB45_06245 [Bradyrhizobium sp. 4]
MLFDFGIGDAQPSEPAPLDVKVLDLIFLSVVSRRSLAHFGGYESDDPTVAGRRERVNVR